MCYSLDSSFHPKSESTHIGAGDLDDSDSDTMASELTPRSVYNQSQCTDSELTDFCDSNPERSSRKELKKDTVKAVSVDIPIIEPGLGGLAGFAASLRPPRSRKARVARKPSDLVNNNDQSDTCTENESQSNHSFDTNCNESRVKSVADSTGATSETQQKSNLRGRGIKMALEPKQSGCVVQ